MRSYRGDPLELGEDMLPGRNGEHFGVKADLAGYRRPAHAVLCRLFCEFVSPGVNVSRRRISGPLRKCSARIPRAGAPSRRPDVARSCHDRRATDLPRLTTYSGRLLLASLLPDHLAGLALRLWRDSRPGGRRDGADLAPTSYRRPPAVSPSRGPARPARTPPLPFSVLPCTEQEERRASGLDAQGAGRLAVTRRGMSVPPDDRTTSCNADDRVTQPWRVGRIVRSPISTSSGWSITNAIARATAVGSIPRSAIFCLACSRTAGSSTALSTSSVRT
jgi:hypothetical protein